MSGPINDPRFSSRLRIPQNSDIEDPVTYAEMTQVLNALRALGQNLDLYTGYLSQLQSLWSGIDPASSILAGNMGKFYAVAASDIAAGAYVNFYQLSGTTVQARPARANSANTAAAGYSLSAVAAGSLGEFITTPGLNTALSGLTPGTWYYLDPASLVGGLTNIIPVAAGNIVQLCGIALTDKYLLTGALNNWRQL